MDINAFSEETFDARDWINSTCQCDEVREDKEAFVNGLVLKIQSYIQQVNTALEDTSQQVLTNLPRVIKDTKLLQLEALTLKEKMCSINFDIDRVQSESGQCMAGLEKLDKLKTQLESAKQSLLEADKWTTLIADIEEIFEQGDVAVVSDRLCAMSKSLDTMGRHVEASDKAAQLEEFRNRLEALASPQIVQAFSTGSIEQSKNMVAIFMSMNRLQQLLSYYKTYQKTGLAQKWSEFTEGNPSNVTWLQDFYAFILQHCREQVKWTSSILPANVAAEAVSNSISELLPTLDPSLGLMLQRSVKHSSDKLTLLIDAVECSRKFASNIAGIININGALPYETQLSLATSVYAHLVSFVSQYPSLESTNLTSLLSALPGAQPEPTDTVQNLSLNNAKVMQSIEQALVRCENITLGCGYPGLARIVEACLISYCDQYSMAIRQLQRCKTYEQDWNTFQICISLLQALGDLHEQVRTLDGKIREHTLENSTKSKGCTNAFLQYKILLLNRDEAKSYDNFLTTLINDVAGDGLFASFYGKLRTLCKDLHKVLFENVSAPILVQIESVVNAPAWGDRSAVLLAPDLPDYSYSPQEYITQIGQYLMTLPQHLEPFLLQPGEKLARALRLGNDEYHDKMAADVLLSLVCKATCAAYSEALLQICRLDNGACKQLAVDIEYLGSVLEELGLKAALGDLSQWPGLLRCPAENYQQQSGNPKLVTAVRQMRGIASTA